MNLTSSHHLNLVVVTDGQLIDGGIPVGVQHVQESTSPMKPTVGGEGGGPPVPIPIARSDGEHVDVIDGAELLEEAAYPVDGPIVRAVGDEELAPLVEGDQGAPGDTAVGGRWHRHDGTKHFKF